MEVLEKVIAAPEKIYQVGYYAEDLDRLIESQEGLGSAGWRKHRRTETIKVYPGTEEHQAVFYVGVHHDRMPNMEVEVIQPLTHPNYINVLELLSGQVAHLAVRAEDFGPRNDSWILYALTGSSGQAIQKGQVRKGRKVSERYTIYQIEGFLPVKIVRQGG